MSKLLKNFLLLLFLCLSSLIASPCVWAAPGDLDTAFANNGLLILNVQGTGDNNAFDGLELSDGRLLFVGNTTELSTAGNIYLLRTDNDGSLDTSFGSGGFVFENFGMNNHAFSVNRIALQGESSVVVGGDVRSIPVVQNGIRSFVARFDLEGNLDTSFGNNGIQTLDFGTGFDEFFTDFVVQSDGRIILTGTSDDRSGGVDEDTIYVARLLVDGSLDISFAGNGFDLRNFGGAGFLSRAGGIALDANNNIVGVGLVEDLGTLEKDSLIFRYLPDGNLDTSFNTTGFRIFSFGVAGDDDNLRGVISQPDGRIVAVGEVSGGTDVALATRFNSDGSFDTNFGNVGVSLGNFNFSNAIALFNVALQDDGRIVVQGNSFFNDGPFGVVDPFVGRYLADGSFDTSFGGDNGGVFINLGSPFQNISENLILQSDGKIVVMGVTVSAAGRQSFVARVLGNTADLAITKAASLTLIDIGEPVSFVLAVSNEGPEEAGGVTVLDELPSVFQIVSVTTTQGTCTSTSSVVCDLGTLALGASVEITIETVAVSGGLVTNTASVFGQVEDPNPDNNSASVVLEVDPFSLSGAGCALNSKASNFSWSTAWALLLFLGFWRFNKSRA